MKYNEYVSTSVFGVLSSSLIGCGVYSMSKDLLDILTNSEVIAVN